MNICLLLAALLVPVHSILPAPYNEIADRSVDPKLLDSLMEVPRQRAFEVYSQRLTRERPSIAYYTPGMRRILTSKLLSLMTVRHMVYLEKADLESLTIDELELCTAQTVFQFPCEMLELMETRHLVSLYNTGMFKNLNVPAQELFIKLARSNETLMSLHADRDKFDESDSFSFE